MFLISVYKTSKRSFVIWLSSIFIVVMALVIALYAVTYLMGSPFEIGKFVHIRKFHFLTLKGVLAKSLLWRTAFTIHLIGGSVGLVLGCFRFFFRFRSCLS